jgi:medium-chain acyl-[acyl-carrier-protein] hydrolase
MSPCSNIPPDPNPENPTPMSYRTPWLVRRPDATRPIRLYCFSYAGGSATAYLQWQTDLEPYVDVCGVQLPGRGSRMGEACLTSLPEIVEQVAQELMWQDDGTFALFGHSLGALLAFEVTRLCASRGMRLPSHLFVSGCDAPRYRQLDEPLHELPDPELIDKLADYGGTPPEILANAELLQLTLPVLRADFALAYRYEYIAQLPLSIPLTVFAGLQDPHTERELVEKWAEETTATTRTHWLDGHHFFINTHRNAVIERVLAELLKLKVGARRT